MKTEKRLTMALSVLVALMMLAVPLASSSNLFVDGGQTNSNGDAPALSSNSFTGDIKNVWIINNQETLDMINDYDKRGVKNFKSDETWNSSGTPWIAIAYVYSEGMNLSVSYDKDGNATADTVEWPNTWLSPEGSSKTAGTQYVLVANLGGSATDKDLAITDSAKYYQEYKFTSKDAKDKEGSASFTYLNNFDKVIDFKLAGESDSLDLTKIDKASVEALTLDRYSVQPCTFSLTGEKNDTIRVIVHQENVYVGDIIKAIKTLTSKSLTAPAGSYALERFGYDLNIDFIAEGTNKKYTAESISANDAVTKDMVLNGSWTLKDKHFLVNVDTYKDGQQDKVYTKAYANDSSQDYHTITENEIKELDTLFELKGWVINERPNESFDPTPAALQVYDKEFLDSNKKEIVAGKTKVADDQTLTLNIDLNDNFYKIEIHSKMFEKDVENGTVVLYAFNTQPATFKEIFTALQNGLDSKGKLIGDNTANDDRLIYEPKVIKEAGSEEYKSNDGNWHIINFIAENDLTYTLNNTKNLIYDDNYESGRAFELNAEIMGYTIIFMVNGEYQVVNVPYGTELSETLTSLNTEDVNHWVYVKGKTASITATDYNGLTGLENLNDASTNVAFEKFSFTDAKRLAVEGQAQSAAGESTPVDFALVLVANFQSSEKTSYAVFDANDYKGKLLDRSVFADKNQVDTTVDGEKIANFGDDERVKKIVISGEKDKKISILPANPVIMDNATDKEKYLFLNWFLQTTTTTTSGSGSAAITTTSTTFTLGLGDFGDIAGNKVSYISADWEKYKNTITFHADGKVNGIFYYQDVNSKNASDDDIDGKEMFDKLVAFSYADKLYPRYLANTGSIDKSENSTYGLYFNDYNSKTFAFDLAATDAFAHVLDPFKAGYYVDTWTDAQSNGKKMIDDVDSSYIERLSGGKLADTEYIQHNHYYAWFDKLTESADFYANFSALGYRIAYNSNSADAPNSVYQIGFADQGMKLLGEKAFSNDKSSTLTSWNDRSDNAGKTYALGADFKFTGEQLDDMGITAYNTNMKNFAGAEAGQTIPAGSAGITGALTLFGIWTFNTEGGDNQGGSSSSDDSTNTYLLVGILIVIIILILVMIFLMRRK